MAYRLSKSVTVSGPDYFGRPAKIVFSPCDSPEWLLHGRKLLRPDSMSTRWRSVRVGHYGPRLEVAEHVLALRATGLMGINIGGDEWPPYHGRTSELWEALKPHLAETSESVPLYTVRTQAAWQYPGRRGNCNSYVLIDPDRGNRQLTIAIICKYGDNPQVRREYTFPDLARFEEIATARPLAWPPLMSHIGDAAKRFRWPHHDRIIWSDTGFLSDAMIEETIRHRAQDLLGVLASLFQDGMFVGRVTSVCAGHRADLEAVYKATQTPLVRCY